MYMWQILVMITQSAWLWVAVLLMTIVGSIATCAFDETAPGDEDTGHVWLLCMTVGVIVYTSLVPLLLDNVHTPKPLTLLESFAYVSVYLGIGVASSLIWWVRYVRRASGYWMNNSITNTTQEFPLINIQAGRIVAVSTAKTYVSARALYWPFFACTYCLGDLGPALVDLGARALTSTVDAATRWAAGLPSTSSTERKQP